MFKTRKSRKFEEKSYECELPGWKFLQSHLTSSNFLVSLRSFPTKKYWVSIDWLCSMVCNHSFRKNSVANFENMKKSNFHFKKVETVLRQCVAWYVTTPTSMPCFWKKPNFIKTMIPTVEIWIVTDTGASPANRGHAGRCFFQQSVSVSAQIIPRV